MKFKEIIVFTDGACSGNPGKGGWASIIAYPDGEIQELGGGYDQTTNNQMELMGPIKALKHIKEDSPEIIIYTDSVYVIRGITQWIWGWRQKGWKTGEGLEVANKSYWQDLFDLVYKKFAVSKNVGSGPSGAAATVGPKGATTGVTTTGSKSKTLVRFQFVRGHKGVPGNERCDEIAVGFTKGRWVDLYQGPLLRYPVAIYDIPEDEALPEIKAKVEKKTAFSYLSYLSGVVYRHSDWGSCERRVKGQSGAKFKKAMSLEDESKILSEWGLSASTPIKE